MATLPQGAGGQPQPDAGSAGDWQTDDRPLELLPPPSFYRPLWRSLLLNLRDQIFPEKLPPLLLTSRPVNVGMLVGDVLSLPWYRTVFTNLGNVITPETLPPLELESRPVETGELISDQLSHLWFSSVLRNMADALVPEKLPPLELTSAPVKPDSASDLLEVPRWSALITGPRLPLPDKAKSAFVLPPPAPRVRPVAQATPALEADPTHLHASRLKTRLTWSRVREACLVAIAVAEAGYLVLSYFF